MQNLCKNVDIIQKLETEVERLRKILKYAEGENERAWAEAQQWKAKYELLESVQHGRNWDDDEAEKKLEMVAEECRELQHKNRLLEMSLRAANDTEEYYAYIPGEENELRSLANGRPVRISSDLLIELLDEAKEEGKKELEAEVERLKVLLEQAKEELENIVGYPAVERLPFYSDTIEALTERTV